MSGISFELFSISLKDLFLLQALSSDEKGRLKISITYDQARMLPIIRKKNTLLFEQLANMEQTDIYRGEGCVIKDFLFDLLFLDLNTLYQTLTPYYEKGTGSARQIVPISVEDLRDFIYQNGIYITGVPQKKARLRGDYGGALQSLGEKEGEDGTQDILLRPFVSSASMARKGQYLFVREELIAPLMERLSLGLVSSKTDLPRLKPGEEGPHFEGGPSLRHLCIQGVTPGSKMSVSKLSAYLGLSLSDGQTLRELKKSFTDTYGTDKETLDLVDVSLNAQSVLCLGPKNNYMLPMDKIGPYVWRTSPWEMEEEFSFHGLPYFDDRQEESAPLSLLLQKLASYKEEHDAREEQKARKEQEATEEQEAREELEAREDLLAFFKSQQGQDAIKSWKQCLRALSPHLEDFPLGESLPLPLPEDFKGEPQSYPYFWALFFGLALFYKRLGLYGYVKGKETLYDVAASSGSVDLKNIKSGQMAALRFDEGVLKDTFLGFAPLDELGIGDEITLDTLLSIALHPSDYCLTLKLSQKKGRQEVLFLLGKPKNIMAAQLVTPGEAEMKSELYDGVGFCDEETFDKLERLLLCQRDLKKGYRRYDALIIRLPFLKGLLVRFNFLDYILEKKGISRDSKDLLGELRLKDAFDASIRRPLFDSQGKPLVHILVNQTMFKIFGQFNKNLSPAPQDPWEEYWRRVNESGYSLLITQKNSAPHQTSRLNYQFLCSLNLTQEELKALAERAMKRLQARSQVPVSFLTENKGLEEEEEMEAQSWEEPAENEEGAPQDSSLEEESEDLDSSLDSQDSQENLNFLDAAIQKNPALACTRFIKNQVYNTSCGWAREAMLGKLEVSGDNRLLVPDLLAMIDYITNAFVVCGPENFNGKAKVVSYINEGALPEGLPSSGLGYYYAPGENAPWNEGTPSQVCVLRNPHFAVGEDALLNPLPDEVRRVYDRWFSHLSGVVFVPGIALLTMNGADSDGDLGNVCCEPIVLEALKRNAEHNKHLLKLVLQNKNLILDLLYEDWSIAPVGPKKQYLSRLRYWTEHSLPTLPEDEQEVSYRFGIAPPIVYAGSGASAVKETAAMLSSECLINEIPGVPYGEYETQSYLESRFWTVFLMTTQASIGLKSIEALKDASVSYVSQGDEKPLEQMDPLELLGAWLSHYRVVNCGLDTATAIDSAKTNILFDTLSLGERSRYDKEELELKESDSSFVKFRSREKKNRTSSKGNDFKESMGRILGNRGGAPDKVPQSPFALDILPSTVFECLPEDLAFVSSANNETLELVDCLSAQSYEDYEGSVKAEAQKRLKACVNTYLTCAKKRSFDLKHRTSLYETYTKILVRIVSLYPLSEAVHIFHVLLGKGIYKDSFWGRYYPSPDAKKQIKRIFDYLNEEVHIARLLWSTPMVRRTVLDQLFEKGEPFLSTRTDSLPASLKAQGAPDPALIEDYELIMNLLTGTEEGIYICKASIRYLLNAVDTCQEIPPEEGFSTPAELWERLLSIVSEFPSLGKSKKDFLYCFLINLAKKGTIQDFLLWDLLGDALPNYVIPADENSSLNKDWPPQPNGLVNVLP